MLHSSDNKPAFSAFGTFSQKLTPIYPRLKPGLLVIAVNSEEFYIGENSSGVYIPTDPYLAVVRGCDGLHSSQSIADLCAIPHGLVLHLLEELQNHNYIEIRSEPQKDPGLDELAIHYQERTAPEHQLFTWREKTSDGGEGEVRDRKNFVIFIFGQNRLARALLANLQASGFSQAKIISPIADAGARIKAQDICGITTKPSDIGRKLSEFHKEIALTSQLTQAGDDSFSHAHSELKTRLIISTSASTSDYVQNWLSEGIPHLQISQLTTHTIEIGPLVIPGVQACLNCVQLHRRDFLPPFIPVAALDNLHQRGRELTSASTSFTAGVVTPYICEFATRGTSPLVGTSLTIDLLEPLHGIRKHHWNVHPECGCGSSNSLI